jgi:2-polyprenyl-3-methyl-5-hydroxy-6-metoxy-1,4-benzoquinol methylase
MTPTRRLAVTARKPLYVAYYRFLFGRRFPGRAAIDRVVRRFEEDTRRGDIPLSRDEWESEYREGRWSYLASADETPRYTRLVELLTRLVPGGAVLDVGCGEGLLRDRLRPHGYRRFVGVDLSEEAVRAARAQADDRDQFVVAPGETFTPDERFDAVVFNECLYYFDDPVAVVERYRPFVTENGVVLVSMFRARRSSAIQRLLRAALPVLDETKVSTERGVWMVTAFAGHGASTR